MDRPTILTGVHGPTMSVTFETHIAHDNSEIRFKCGPAFREAMNDPMLAATGRTVGEERIEELRELLDEWIKANKE